MPSSRVRSVLNILTIKELTYNAQFNFYFPKLFVGSLAFFSCFPPLKAWNIYSPQAPDSSPKGWQQNLPPFLSAPCRVKAGHEFGIELSKNHQDLMILLASSKVLPTWHRHQGQPVLAFLQSIGLHLSSRTRLNIRLKSPFAASKSISADLPCL